MCAFKVLLLLKTLSWEQINSSSFGLVWKCLTWKQFSHWLECCWLQWPHWGRNKCVLSDVWLGDVMPLGFESQVPFLPPHAPSPLPGLLPRWPYTSSQLFQHSWRGMCSGKEEQGPFGGQHMLAFHSSSYITVSHLHVKALYWPQNHCLRPSELQSWTQEKEVWGMSPYSADILDGQNFSIIQWSV